MPYENIPNTPNNSELNLSNFPDLEGKDVRCVVTAEGLDTNGNPVNSLIETEDVRILAVDPPEPGDDPRIISLSLDTSVTGQVTGTATIEFVDVNGNNAVNIEDLTEAGWDVEWDWRATQGSGNTEYDASWMYKNRPPMARWISHNYKMTRSNEEPIGVFAKAIAGIQKVEIYRQINPFITDENDKWPWQQGKTPRGICSKSFDAKWYVPISGSTTTHKPVSYEVQEGQTFRDYKDPNRSPSYPWELYDTIETETPQDIDGNTVFGYWTTYDASSHPPGTEVRFYAKIYAFSKDGPPVEETILELRDGVFEPLDGQLNYPTDEEVTSGAANTLNRRTLRVSEYGELCGLAPYGQQVPFKLARASGGANVFNGSYTHVLRCLDYEDSQATTIYVNWNGGSDKTGDGTKANPYKTIQGGIYSKAYLGSGNGNKPLSYYRVNLGAGDQYCFSYSFGSQNAGGSGRWPYVGGFFAPNTSEPFSANILVQRDPDLGPDEDVTRIVGTKTCRNSETVERFLDAVQEYQENGNTAGFEEFDGRPGWSIDPSKFNIGWAHLFAGQDDWGGDGEEPIYTDGINAGFPTGDQGGLVFKNITFLNSEKFNDPPLEEKSLDKFRESIGGARLFQRPTKNSLAYYNCRFEEEWDGVYDVNTPVRGTAIKGSSRFSYMINTTYDNASNPQSSSVTINEKAENCIEDFCNTGMGYDMGVDILDNGVVSGYRDDNFANYQIRLPSVPDVNTTTLSGTMWRPFYDRDRVAVTAVNGPEKRTLQEINIGWLNGEFLHFELNDDGSAVLSIERDRLPYQVVKYEDDVTKEISTYRTPWSRGNYYNTPKRNGSEDPRGTEEEIERNSEFSSDELGKASNWRSHQERHLNFGLFVSDYVPNQLGGPKENTWPGGRKADNSIFMSADAEMEYGPRGDADVDSGVGVVYFRWPTNSLRAEKFKILKEQLMEEGKDNLHFQRGGTPHPDIAQYYGVRAGREWTGDVFAENYTDGDPRRVQSDNLMLYKIKATGDQNHSQGLYLGGYGPHSNAYFGEVEIDHYSTITGYGRTDAGNVNNHYVNQQEINVLYDKCKFTSSTVVFRRNNPTWNGPNNLKNYGIALDTVFRNCDYLDYADNHPSGKKSSAPLRLNDDKRQRHYGSDEGLEIVPDYPKVGFLAGSDGTNDGYASNFFEGRGTFALRGHPPFPWHSLPMRQDLVYDDNGNPLPDYGKFGRHTDPNDERDEIVIDGRGISTLRGGSGYRYEGDFRGLPPE